MKPMISLAAATGLVEALKAEGADTDEVLASFGLDRSTVSNPHGFIPAADFARLMEECARATGDACFGLHLGEHFNPKDIGALTYVMLNAPTMTLAFKDVARYLHVFNEAAEVSFVVEGKWVYLRHRLLLVGVDHARQQNECAMALGLNAIRLMAGSQWSPAEVQFAHPAPEQTAEHRRIFGSPVSFDCPTNAFVVEREFIDRQVPAADDRLYPILKRYLDHVLEQMPREHRTLGSIRKAIGESMRDGDPTLAQVAAKVAMGARTLQRRLAEHGTDFKGLVDDTRRRFSQHYLRDPRHTLSEIAYLLGYSEVSAFNRAFRRWTGSTPSEYRQRVTRAAASRRGSPEAGGRRPDRARRAPRE
ncbi:MAG TPA: AraC family transcriptional regulator [Candidatus Methylomirabilis sp.]|nr:AraC family transcriptional regulator [Candidatus Methylomirabilis sp.]